MALKNPSEDPRHPWAYGALAHNMNGLLPEGPDKTVALRAIRDAAMHANAAIACAQRIHVEA